MGRHTESPDADASSLSDATSVHGTVPDAPVHLTRRELRQREAANAAVVSDADVLADDGEAVRVADAVTETAAPSHTAIQQTSSPRKASVRTAPPRAAPPRGMSSARGPQRKKRHVTARLLTATAMVFVAAIAVATSVPANALLSTKDIQALSSTQAKGVVSTIQDGQSVDGTGVSVAAGRDTVSVSGASPVKAYTDLTSQKISPIVPVSTGPILWPFPNPVALTDGFGARQGMWTAGGYTGNFHTGQDFDPGAGTPIQAVADGIVSEVSSTLCGTSIVIDHNVNGEKFESEYCHMVYGSAKVTVGESITAGTVIGNVGETGMATGPHLHLEIHVNGNAIDPLGFLRSRSHEWPA